MATPSSGQISVADILAERNGWVGGRSDTDFAEIVVDMDTGAWTSTPNLVVAAPHSMSEFYNAEYPNTTISTPSPQFEITSSESETEVISDTFFFTLAYTQGTSTVGRFASPDLPDYYSYALGSTPGTPTLTVDTTGISESALDIRVKIKVLRPSSSPWTRYYAVRCVNNGVTAYADFEVDWYEEGEPE